MLHDVWPREEYVPVGQGLGARSILGHSYPAGHVKQSVPPLTDE